MTKSDFKKQVLALLSNSVDGLDYDDKAAVVRRTVTEFERKQTWDTSKTGEPWADDELSRCTQSCSNARKHLTTREGVQT
jgi:hypothetical protein